MDWVAVFPTEVVRAVQLKVAEHWNAELALGVGLWDMRRGINIEVRQK
jgi:hypothetical protein